MAAAMHNLVVARLSAGFTNVPGELRKENLLANALDNRVRQLKKETPPVPSAAPFAVWRAAYTAAPPAPHPLVPPAPPPAAATVPPAPTPAAMMEVSAAASPSKRQRE